MKRARVETRTGTSVNHEGHDGAASGQIDRFHPAALSVASALLFWLSFPPADRGYLAWIALIPLLMLVVSPPRRWVDYAGAWAGGLVFGTLSLSWVAQVSLPGMGLMALFMSVWWPLFVALARLGVRRFRIPIVVVVPIVWVALEYSRTLFLSGFPWYYLAHSQYAYLPIIQVCDIAGAWGLGFVIAMVNVLLAEVLIDGWLSTQTPSKKWLAIKGAAAIGLVGAVAVYGSLRMGAARFEPGPRVALLQTDFAQVLGNGPPLDVVFSTIQQLLAEAVRSEPRVDLIVWPETSYPMGVVTIEDALGESDLTALAKRLDPESTGADWKDRGARSREDLKTLLSGARTPMVIGTTTYAFSRAGVDRFNSAVYTDPLSTATRSYFKRALVPFGEYIPFLQAMPWLLALTPYQDGYIPSLTHGREPVLFESQNVRYAPAICFEDTLPAVIRQSMLADSGRPIDVILNLTNDGWFRGSAEHRVHLAISIFRAVECRVPIARSVNTGISAVIDGHGRVVASVPEATSAVLAATVPLDPRSSLYLVVGDLLPQACLVFTVGLVVIASLQIRHSATLAHSPSVG